jgi:hypothetical protein
MEHLPTLVFLATGGFQLNIFQQPPGNVQLDVQVLMFSEFSVRRRMVIQFGVLRIDRKVV